ncbi:CcdB family protein [Aliarcobacter butzleri]|uniref:Toxin CcdB n=1 Tax=Aliarcobacter butzleri TaxID=28197 RepID=A0AAW7QCU0_9BACT|nr:CcdB family protein [Aliarcobacter butzleri]MCP3650434.1 CcdB family protein [Arcobacter sp. DNRA7]MCR1816607.1 CcdB family protein [Aliarcobacter butzleri]MDN5108255.1 CcdB family protein [Aliarcobacter butzleri]MDN5124311.1 CcdB family protein [Aliarcobacter butzleri]
MAQFDVYKNENDQTNQKVPYLLNIQNDILDSINTRIVIPLVKNKNDFKGLTKEFVIENQKVYLTTSQMGAVHKNELKNKVISLDNQKEEIKNSIDFLIYGF